MTLADWMEAARKAAIHYWAYEDLVLDANDKLVAAYWRGDEPDAAIKEIGIELGLFEFGKHWGGY